MGVSSCSGLLALVAYIQAVGGEGLSEVERICALSDACCKTSSPVGMASRSSSTRKLLSYQPVNRSNIKIVVPLHSYFAKYDAAAGSGNGRFSGYAIDVLKEIRIQQISQGQTFEYSLSLPPTANSLESAVDMLDAGHADLLCSGFSNPQVNQLIGTNVGQPSKISFSTPFAAQGFVMVREAVPRMFKLVPFSSIVEIVSTYSLPVCAATNSSASAFITQRFQQAGKPPLVIDLANDELGTWRAALTDGKCAAVVTEKTNADYQLDTHRQQRQLTANHRHNQQFRQRALGGTLITSLEQNLVVWGSPEHIAPVSLVTRLGDTTSMTELDIASEKSFLRNLSYGITFLSETERLHALESKYTDSIKQSVRRTGDLSGHHFNIVTVVDPPFVRFNPSLSGNARFSGYIMDLIAEVAKRGDFSYTLLLSSDGTYTGGVRDVLDSSKVGDMYWAGYFITPQRAEVADFTVPFVDTGLTLVTAGEKERVKLLSTSWFTTHVGLKPFKSRLWYAIIGMALFSGLMFFILEHGGRVQRMVEEVEQKPKRITLGDGGGRGGEGKETDEPEGEHEEESCKDLLIENIYFGFSSLSGLLVPEPLSKGGQIFSIVYNFCCIIFVSAYTANLASHLTGEVADSSFVSVEEMIQADLRLCNKAGTAFGNYINSEYGDVLSIRMEESLAALAANVQGLPFPGQQNGTTRCDAFVEVSLLTNYITGRPMTTLAQDDGSDWPQCTIPGAIRPKACSKCSLRETGEMFWHQSMACGVNKALAGVADGLSVHISEMRANDRLNDLFVKHFSGQQSSCRKTRVEQPASQIDVDHVSMPVAAMFVFGSIMIVVELVAESHADHKSKLRPQAKFPKIMTVAQLRRVYGNHLTEDANEDTINYKEFCKMINHPALRAGEPKLSYREIDRVLREVDVDGDGTVQFSELASWCFQKTFAIWVLTLLSREKAEEDSVRQDSAVESKVMESQQLPKIASTGVALSHAFSRLWHGDTCTIGTKEQRDKKREAMRLDLFRQFAKALQAVDDEVAVEIASDATLTLHSSRTSKGETSKISSVEILDTNEDASNSSVAGLPSWLLGMLLCHYGSSFEHHGIDDVSKEISFEKLSAFLDTLKKPEARRKTNAKGVFAAVRATIRRLSSDGSTNQQMNPQGPQIGPHQVAPAPMSTSTSLES